MQPADGFAAARQEQAALPLATLKARPEDFVVEEIPAYAASGSGDHLFVTFRKVDLTTTDAVGALARALGLDPREAGVAGMKDKVAVATQTASFFLARGNDAEARLAAHPVISGISVLSFARHPHKLKPGHLVGNRFKIRLGLPDITTDSGLIEQRLERVRSLGVPNRYGSQRFGRQGDNASRAAAFVRGEVRPPRDKKRLRFLFSALQSELFNDLLDRRVDDDTWARVLPGDLAKKHDSGGLFAVPLEGPELQDAQSRAAAGQISATGPMFGASMRAPQGAVQQLEAAVLAASGLSHEQLAAFRNAGEGTRRPLRLMADELTWELASKSIELGFVLPKGGYATTLLENVCRLVESERSVDPSSPGGEADLHTGPTTESSDLAPDEQERSTFPQ